MELNELKKIDIKTYLAERGLHPKRDRNYYGMYFSPFRDETEASLKVDYNKNLWIDFGSGEGGTIIDMVMKLDNCTLVDAIKILKNHSFGNDISFSPIGITERPDAAPLIEISKIKPLANKSLIKYLQERCINIDIAKAYCLEVYYKINQKHYYAIGFKNDSDGYELRNRYFKGCTSKDITSIISGTQSCSVFEGFIDFLSYLTINNIHACVEDIIVLNTAYNFEKSLTILSSHDLIHSFFDNDDIGRELTKKLKVTFSNVVSLSNKYKDFNDLNDFLLNNSIKDDFHFRI